MWDIRKALFNADLDIFYVHPRARVFNLVIGWLLLHGARLSQMWRETFRTVRSQNDSENASRLPAAEQESFTIGARSACH